MSEVTTENVEVDETVEITDTSEEDVMVIGDDLETNTDDVMSESELLDLINSADVTVSELSDVVDLENVELLETQTTMEITSMGIPFLGMSVLQVVVALSLIIVILQQSKTASSMMSSGGTDNSYWSKNKGRSKESQLERLTIILGALFFVATMILSVLK